MAKLGLRVSGAVLLLLLYPSVADVLCEITLCLLIKWFPIVGVLLVFLLKINACLFLSCGQYLNKYSILLCIHLSIVTLNM